MQNLTEIKSGLKKKLNVYFWLVRFYYFMSCQELEPFLGLYSLVLKDRMLSAALQFGSPQTDIFKVKAVWSVGLPSFLYLYLSNRLFSLHIVFNLYLLYPKPPFFLTSDFLSQVTSCFWNHLFAKMCLSSDSSLVKAIVCYSKMFISS